MMSSIPPGTLLVLGALAVPLLKGRLPSAWMLLLPVLTLLLRGHAAAFNSAITSATSNPERATTTT